MAFTQEMTNGTIAKPKITLYTNHLCPYAHRAHITLKELELPYEEVIIDLTKPREPWYLDINPRGLVPAIKYSKDPDFKDEVIVTESAIVAQFLADLHPSPLLPASSASPAAALTRARIAFFIDTWNTKIAPFHSAMAIEDTAEKEAKCKEWLVVLTKEIEPLLQGANPFFGGSKEFTMVEVHTAPFLLRVYAMAPKRELLPASLKNGLDVLPNFSKWARATIARESATYIWDEKMVFEATTARLAKIRAQAKAQGK